MSKRIAALIPAAMLLALAFAVPAQAGARYSYTLTDAGTLGGPQSFINLPGFPITRQGAVLGTADTKVADSDYPNFNPFIVGVADPYTAHAFKWQDGKRTDLGALPGNNSSAVFQINGSGVGAGISETGALDPNTGYPAENAVLFKNGSVINLGTLPGGHESQATAINDRGQVAGFGDNGVRDPVSIFGPVNGPGDPGWVTQTRSFIWQNGKMRDLGTLGGDFGAANYVNDAGDVTGWTTVPGDSTAHAFLWKHGVMTDLTGAGSSQCTVTEVINDRDQIVGHTCDEQDALLWTGGKQYELDSLVAPSGIHLTAADFINDRGQIVALGTLPNGHQHLFLLNPTNTAPGAAVGSVSHQSGEHHFTNLTSTPSKRFLPRG
jgi:probable HAF family extracellular repeat protein